MRHETSTNTSNNAFGTMSRLLDKPPPLTPTILSCGSRFTRRWTRQEFHGYVPGMSGHLIATYYSDPQYCASTMEGRRKEGLLRPGAVTVVADRHDAYWDSNGPVNVSHVYLTKARLQDCTNEIGSSQHADILDRIGIEDAISAHILAVLSDDDILLEPSERVLIERGVDLLCLQLLRRHCSVPASKSAPHACGGLSRFQIKRITDYAMAHLDHPIGLEELAAQAGLSRYYFCTAFRTATGSTPHTWLTNRRMARARDLLVNQALSISDVALAVGYSTPSAFTASFRKIVGVTPSNYRRNL